MMIHYNTAQMELKSSHQDGLGMVKLVLGRDFHIIYTDDPTFFDLKLGRTKVGRKREKERRKSSMARYETLLG
jgi:hypothetical protein